jgi:hypothetical protein
MIEIGEYAKVINENRVFKVIGYTKDMKAIPGGWLVDEDECCVNPKYCEKYQGATSCLEAKD